MYLFRARTLSCMYMCVFWFRFSYIENICTSPYKVQCCQQAEVRKPFLIFRLYVKVDRIHRRFLKYIFQHTKRDYVGNGVDQSDIAVTHTIDVLMARSKQYGTERSNMLI